MAAEDEADFLLSPGRIRGGDSLTRSVLYQRLFVKSGDRSMRLEVETSPEGLEFTSGKAESMLVQLSACSLLAEAIVNWNSHEKEKLLNVPALLKSYMSNVSRIHWYQHPWASKVLARMWTSWKR